MHKDRLCHWCYRKQFEEQSKHTAQICQCEKIRHDCRIYQMHLKISLSYTKESCILHESQQDRKC